MSVFVQGVWRGGGDPPGGSAAVGSGTITLGNTLVLAICHEGVHGVLDCLSFIHYTGPYDNLGNTWTRGPAFWNHDGAQWGWVYIEIWTCVVTNPGVLTTVNWGIRFGAFSARPGAVVTEWREWSSTANLETHTIYPSLSVSTDCGAGLQPGVTQLLLGVTFGGANVVLPPGWLIANSYEMPPGSTMYHCYREDSFSGIQTSTWDGDGQAIQLISFLSAGDYIPQIYRTKAP